MMVKMSTKFGFLLLTIAIINLSTITTAVQLLGEKAVNCGNFVYWVRGGYFVANEYLVKGGRELSTHARGYPFYICRVKRDHGTFIGKFIKSEVESKETPSQCWITNGYRETAYEDPTTYEVLADYAGNSGSLVWEPTNLGVAPLTAFWAGLTSKGRSVFIGQCTITFWGDDRTVIPGTVEGSSASMNVAFNNNSPKCSPERVLICKKD